MFKELAPILRNRAVVLTVSVLGDDHIRVNVVPKKINDSDNDALTTPLSVTGTAEELDAELASTLVSFVASHLQMKGALDKAQSEMEAATKAAQAEGRSKTKTATNRAPAMNDTAAGTVSQLTDAAKPATAKPASLFDVPAPAEEKAESDGDNGHAAEHEDSEELHEVA